MTRALRAFPLVLRPDEAGEATLVGHSDHPVMAALGRIVAGYAAGHLTGQWRRLRQCPATDCAWVFWDSSAKGARRWCTMGVCGNRAKVRPYAARRAALRPAAPAADGPG